MMPLLAHTYEHRRGECHRESVSWNSWKLLEELAITDTHVAVIRQEAPAIVMSRPREHSHDRSSADKNLIGI